MYTFMRADQLQFPAREVNFSRGRVFLMYWNSRRHPLAFKKVWFKPDSSWDQTYLVSMDGIAINEITLSISVLSVQIFLIFLITVCLFCEHQ